MQMKAASYQREQVVDIINTVIGRLQGTGALPRDMLSRELRELKDIIDMLRGELCAARPHDISRAYLPNAADELDAVVNATEKAALDILNACELILGTVKDTAPSTSRAVEDAVIRIFEACAFQDIAGQRIRKVTGSLQTIDSKIKSILSALDGQLGMIAPYAVLGGMDSGGPSLPGQGIAQAEIDSLLAAFDDRGH